MNVSERGFFRLMLGLFIGSIVITGLFISGLFHLEVDYDFEKFFPEDSEDTEFFFNYREEFDSDNDYILIGLGNDGTLFDYDFLKDVDSLTRRLERLELVQHSISLTNQKNYAKTPFGFEMFEIPYINFEEKNSRKDSTQIFQNKELVGFLISSNAKYLNIYIKHENYLSKAKCDILLREVQNLIDEYDFDEVHLAGRTVGQFYYVNQMQKELKLFFIVSAILVILFLYTAFKSFQGVLFPLIIVLSSMIWIFGFMGLIHEPVNILLTILPTIMFVVSMSDVIHFVSRYIDEKRIGVNSIAALKVTVKEVGLATFLTSLTTSIGFLSLFLVKVEPIKEFGVYTGIGVILAFLATYGMLPFFLLISNKIDGRGRKVSRSYWENGLRKLFVYVLRRRILIYTVSFITVVVSVYGITKIDKNHYILDDVSKDSSVKQDALFFDKNFGGVRPFQLAVKLVNDQDSLMSLPVLQEIEKIENYLIKEYGVGRINSLASVFKIINRINNGANPEYYKLPETNKKIGKYKKKFLTKENMNPAKMMVSKDERSTRIIGSIGDLGSQIIKEKNIDFQKFIDQEINAEIIEVKITGTAHLLDQNMESLADSIFYGLGIAIVIVSLIMAILYKSLKIVVISIIPNVIPLIIIAGIMGFFGIQFKVTTAIIFTIAFGICVDDTIHFLSKFNHEMRKGKGKLYALKRTYLATGKAIILTSLILCSGFLMLIFSNFSGTFYTGVLITIALLFAVIADLTILPILLLGIKGNEKEAEPSASFNKQTTN
jgi:predicted RND superfamily exporter protein